MNTSLPKSSTEKTVRKRRASMEAGRLRLDHGRGGAAGEALAEPGPIQVELYAEHYQPPQQGRRIGGVVLTVEVEHSLMKGNLRPVAMPAGGTFDVYHGDGRIVAHFPAGLVDGGGPVQVLTIHKKRLIQEAGLGDGFPPDNHARAHHRPNFGFDIGAEVGEIVLAEAAAARKQAAETQHPINEGVKCQTAPAGQVQLAVWQ